MIKYNVSIVYNKDMTKLLMCLRSKDPYKGKYNFVGGKIESEDHLEEAYRELFEETSITKVDIELSHFMDIVYYKFDYSLEIYLGTLNKDLDVVEEVNKLEWIDINENFFDMNKFAGDGVIGHILEEVNIYLKERN